MPEGQNYQSVSWKRVQVHVLGLITSVSTGILSVRPE